MKIPKNCFYVILYAIFAVMIAPAVWTQQNQPLSLMAAIEESGKQIAAQLPPKSRVAIVAFKSLNDALSDFIMEELTGALFDRGIEVADRQNLSYVFQELNFQMSGDMSDETAMSIGKFLGANMVIIGQLVYIGSDYRYQTSAIHVEQATRSSVIRLTVRNNQETQSMFEAFANEQGTVKNVKYGVSEDKMPQTAGTFLDRGILFASQGERDKAVSDFDMAIRFDPNLDMAYFLRTRLLWPNNEFTQQLPMPDRFKISDVLDADTFFVASFPDIGIAGIKAYVEKVKNAGFIIGEKINDNNNMYVFEAGNAKGYKVHIYSAAGASGISMTKN